MMRALLVREQHGHPVLHQEAAQCSLVRCAFRPDRKASAQLSDDHGGQQDCLRILECRDHVRFAAAEVDVAVRVQRQRLMTRATRRSDPAQPARCRIRDRPATCPQDRSDAAAAPPHPQVPRRGPAPGSRPRSGSSPRAGPGHAAPDPEPANIPERVLHAANVGYAFNAGEQTAGVYRRRRITVLAPVMSIAGARSQIRSARPARPFRQ
jgi:hypothetical protein